MEGGAQEERVVETGAQPSETTLEQLPPAPVQLPPSGRSWAMKRLLLFQMPGPGAVVTQQH